VFPGEYQCWSAHRRSDSSHEDKMKRGWFAIGIENYAKTHNVGTIYRSAHIFGASYIFTIGRKYEVQFSDTTKAWRHIPLIHFDSLDDLFAHRPKDAAIVGVELNDGAKPIDTFSHPMNAIYLLGNERNGIAPSKMTKMDCLVRLPAPNLNISMNVAVAGSIILFDRWSKQMQMKSGI
jgi:tRNA G18 (ribose-2'-O)-methylase SpoU